MIRVFISLLILAGLVGFLDQEQRAGRFRQVDEGFRDFLIANVRDRFVPDPAAEPSQVVLVEMKEAEASEFDAWPPSPLDWRMVLEAVAQWEPDVLVIAEPLNWGQPAPPFVAAVGEVMQRFPSLVLAVEAEYASESSPAFLGGLGSRFPRFTSVVGQPGAMNRWLRALVLPPDETLRPQAELGLLIAPTAVDGGGQIPYTVQLDQGQAQNQWLPTLVAQAVSRLARSPYALQRLRLGPGAGVHLEGGRFVPLTTDGQFEWSVPKTSRVIRINALDLLAGSLAEVVPEPTLALAKEAKVVLLGVQRGDGKELLHQADALAAILTLPSLHQLSPIGQWSVWGVAGLLALILAQRKPKALGRALILVFAGFVISYLVFQSQLIWFPPTIPAALLFVGGLLGKVIGRKPPVPTPPTSNPDEAVKSSEASANAA